MSFAPAAAAAAVASAASALKGASSSYAIDQLVYNCVERHATPVSSVVAPRTLERSLA